ncbi:MAG: SprT family zinc-dependent metalloprotease [Pseudomonadota bacterium]
MKRSEPHSTPSLRVGDPPIEITVRRHRNARRLTLRVANVSSEVVLTAPTRTPVSELERFAVSRLDWVRSCLARRPASVSIEPGAVLPVAGEALTLARGQGRTALRAGNRLLVPGEGARYSSRVKAWVIDEARAAVTLAADRYADRLGRSYTAITLRDPRSRWGSCSSEGRLMFSWRLLLAPPMVLNYVAAHEVAHLVELNHSPRYWALLNDLFDGVDEGRRWLRSDGAAQLHRYQF